MRATSMPLCALLSVVVVTSVPAQASRPVPTGALVRVRTANNPSVVVGQLVALSDSALLVRQLDSGDVSIPRSDVERLEVRRRVSRGENARKGALIGLAIGGVLGVAAGDDCDSGDFICFDRRATGAFGAFAGLSIGTLIGVVTGGGERWRATAVPMRLSMVPIAGRSVSIVSSIAF